MNIFLNAHFEKFVEEAVASGRFNSFSEVIRQGLRLLEERELRLAGLRREIRKGRQSGGSVPYDPEGIKRRGRKTLRQWQGQTA